MLTVVWSKDAHVKLHIIPRLHGYVSGELYMTSQSLGIMTLLLWAPWQEAQSPKGQAGLVSQTEKDERGFVNGSTTYRKARRCTSNSPTIQTLPFFPSKLPSANVSAMKMKEAHHDSPFNES